MKLKFKIFALEKDIVLNATNSGIEILRKKCFEEVIVFKSLEKAKKWKDDNQKFKGQYVIYNCF